LDLGTIIGIVVGLVLVMVSILLKGTILAFVDIASMLIVGGGTLAATMVAFPMSSVMRALKASMSIFFQHRIDHVGTVRTLLSASNTARKDGPLALEKMKANNDFMKTAFGLVADGFRPEDIGAVLRIELDATSARQEELVKILEKMSDLAPAWGMIGTLIGLVIMLLNLDDPNSIGPAMAVALLTTLYGALWANLLLSPGAAKLAERGEREILDYRLILEGAMAMARNENPRAIQQRLVGFMPPEDRSALQAKAMAKKKG
jgi:chemotaxis protein MotA